MIFFALIKAASDAEMSQIPYIVSPHWLASELTKQPEKYLLIDMSKPGIYAQAHLHNAINLDYNRLVAAAGSMEFIPTKTEIEQLLSELGLTENLHVIAYDEEGGTRAARFLWILWGFLGGRTSSTRTKLGAANCNALLAN